MFGDLSDSNASTAKMWTLLSLVYEVSKMTQAGPCSDSYHSHRPDQGRSFPCRNIFPSHERIDLGQQRCLLTISWIRPPYTEGTDRESFGPPPTKGIRRV
jgi:hypothetical protein